MHIRMEGASASRSPLWLQGWVGHLGTSAGARFRVLEPACICAGPTGYRGLGRWDVPKCRLHRVVVVACQDHSPPIPAASLTLMGALAHVKLVARLSPHATPKPNVATLPSLRGSYRRSRPPTRARGEAPVQTWGATLR